MSEFDDPPTTGGGDNIYTQLFVQRLMLEWRSPDALHVMVALALSFVITRTVWRFPLLLCTLYIFFAVAEFTRKTPLQQKTYDAAVPSHPMGQMHQRCRWLFDMS